MSKSGPYRSFIFIFIFIFFKKTTKHNLANNVFLQRLKLQH